MAGKAGAQTTARVGSRKGSGGVHGPTLQWQSCLWMPSLEDVLSSAFLWDCLVLLI